jgi:hypothetical protein
MQGMTSEHWIPQNIDHFVSQWARLDTFNPPAINPKPKEPPIASACIYLRSGFKMFCARFSVRRTNSFTHIFPKCSRRIVAAEAIDSRTRCLYSTSTNTRIIRSTSHHPDIPVPTNKSYVEFILERCELHGEKHAIVSSYSLFGSFIACCLSTVAKLFTLTILFDRSSATLKLGPLLMYSYSFGTRIWLPNVHIPAWNFRNCRLLSRYGTK